MVCIPHVSAVGITVVPENLIRAIKFFKDVFGFREDEAKKDLWTQDIIHLTHRDGSGVVLFADSKVNPKDPFRVGDKVFFRCDDLHRANQLMEKIREWAKENGLAEQLTHNIVGSSYVVSLPAVLRSQLIIGK